MKLKDKKGYYITVVIILLILLVLSILISLSLGSVKIGIGTTYKVLIGKLFHIESLLDGIGKPIESIIWQIRAPRVLLGCVAGAGLALCGVIMQSSVNNPIVEPYILGVSSGATFGATLVLMLGIGVILPIGAFIGAVLATFLVFVISKGKGKMTALRLILAGTVVNALFTGLSNFIISVSSNTDSITALKFWTMGSLSSASWSNIWLPLIIVLLATFFFLTQGRILNAMMLGDEAAHTLGINLSLYRLIYLIIVAIITGVLVSSCGIIAFVGLVIPHISRSIIGNNNKRLILVVILLGAIFLLWADVLSRVLIEYSELPIGVFTSLIGGIFFIYIVMKKGYGDS
ncbi:MAG: FecCD family ABC transporter permease [Anaeroplasmataceae bacterium]